MCERMEAVRSLRQAAKDLTKTCLADAVRTPPVTPTPEDMRALTQQIDDVMARRKYDH